MFIVIVVKSENVDNNAKTKVGEIYNFVTKNQSNKKAFWVSFN